MTPRKKRPAPPSTPYRAYLRGRLRAAGLLDDAEAKLYAAPELPTNLLVGFVVGALASEGAPLLSEPQLAAEVAARLAGPVTDAGPC